MPSVSEKVKVRYVDELAYTLDVEVTRVCPSNEFIARVERIFSNGGEITGGDILALTGREITFKNQDIVLRQT
jgi:hypothetical protein